MTKEEILLKLNSLCQSKANAAESGTLLNEISDLAGDIERNHVLSKELWATELPAAQLLSFLTEQPEKVTEMQLDDRIQGISSPDLIDVYCKSVVFGSPYLNAKLEEWSLSDSALIRRAGYVLVWLKAKKGQDFTDVDFEVFLQRIRSEIKNEKDVVKEAMCYALIAIGRRNRFLNNKAREVAQEIGEVQFSGYSEHKMPNVEAILKSDKIFTSI